MVCGLLCSMQTGSAYRLMKFISSDATSTVDMQISQNAQWLLEYNALCIAKIIQQSKHPVNLTAHTHTHTGYQ